MPDHRLEFQNHLLVPNKVSKKPKVAKESSTCRLRYFKLRSLHLLRFGYSSSGYDLILTFQDSRKLFGHDPKQSTNHQRQADADQGIGQIERRQRGPGQ